jgi:GNAT superfamily N-acetyltransferase
VFADANENVRLALPAEAQEIANVQRRVWAADRDLAVTSLLQRLDVDAMRELWRRAISAPPAARYRVLVALAQGRVVGFATTSPSTDPDADVATDGAVEELAIDPVARRRGHGSRLLNACADTLRADGFTRATCWLRQFLTTAGWAADGASREIGSEEEIARLKQIRLHTDLSSAAALPRR